MIGKTLNKQKRGWSLPIFYKKLSSHSCQRYLNTFCTICLPIKKPFIQVYDDFVSFLVFKKQELDKEHAN